MMMDIRDNNAPLSVADEVEEGRTHQVTVDDLVSRENDSGCCSSTSSTTATADIAVAPGMRMMIETR